MYNALVASFSYLKQIFIELRLQFLISFLASILKDTMLICENRIGYCIPKQLNFAIARKSGNIR